MTRLVGFDICFEIAEDHFMVESTSGKTSTQPILILILIVGFSVIVHKMVFSNSVILCLWSAHLVLHNMCNTFLMYALLGQAV